MSTAAELVFVCVVGARFLVPLFILRYPLPSILASLVLDAVDQTIFQSMGHDPPGYQGYDKAMDVYYLAIAHVATLRNWTNGPAYAVGRALYFHRLAGVVAFELAQWRPLLLLFPNTFEYFCIPYEVVRLRWDPRNLSLRAWVADELAAHAWLAPLIVLVVVAVLVVLRLKVLPHLGAPSWGCRVPSDPLPTVIDEAPERAAWASEHVKVWSSVTLEKAVLVGLITVTFGQVLPGVRSSPSQPLVGMAAFVLINAALALAVARLGRTVEGAPAAFATRVAVNVALVFGSTWLLGRLGGELNLGATLFFVLLLSLITTLHDRYWPVHAVLMAEQAHDR